MASANIVNTPETTITVPSPLPYAPSWFDNLKSWVETLRMPWWVFYSLLAGAFIALELGLQWQAGLLGKTVSRIDPATNKIIAQIDMGVQVMDVAVWQRAVWAAVSPQRLWGTGHTTCDATNSFLARIDPQTNHVVGKLAAPCAFQIVPDTNALWVLDWGENPDPTQNSIIRVEPVLLAAAKP